jgi:glycosyltransferase involved in cell wall biosynthesis
MLTLSSLKRQSLVPHSFEVIVANDGGSPEVESVCYDYNVRCINIVPNRGSYYARNRAIEQAHAANFAFVDADITVPTQWLERGLAVLEQAHYVAGDIEIEKDKIREVADLYEFYTAFDIHKYIQKYHFGVTANLFVKQEVFDKVGLFEERLRSSGDLEFGDRVYAAGIFQQRYEPELKVLHPPRGFEKYKSKIRRGCVGQVKLKQLYPKRFPDIVPSIFKSVVKMLLPPNPLQANYLRGSEEKRIQLFLFGWYVNFLKGYYTAKAILSA